MNTVVSTSEIRFTETEAGVLRIGRSRVSLDSVIHAFEQGSTPEEIASDYDAISLIEVYATISYYLQNRGEVKKYLARRLVENVGLRSAVENRFPQAGLRQRLLDRQKVPG